MFFNLTIFIIKQMKDNKLQANSNLGCKGLHVASSFQHLH